MLLKFLYPDISLNQICQHCIIWTTGKESLVEMGMKCSLDSSSRFIEHHNRCLAVWHPARSIGHLLGGSIPASLPHLLQVLPLRGCLPEGAGHRTTEHLLQHSTYEDKPLNWNFVPISSYGRNSTRTLITFLLPSA